MLTSISSTESDKNSILCQLIAFCRTFFWLDIIFHLTVTNHLILKFEKRSFWKASLIVLPFTIISVPPKSEKQNKKTNMVRKTRGFKIFKNCHLLFTLMVGCWWFLKNITRLVSSFTTQDSLLQPTNTQTLKGEEMEKPLQED